MNAMSEVLDCTIRDGGYYTDWDLFDELSKQIKTNTKRRLI